MPPQSSVQRDEEISDTDFGRRVPMISMSILMSVWTLVGLSSITTPGVCIVAANIVANRIFIFKEY